MFDVWCHGQLVLHDASTHFVQLIKEMLTVDTQPQSGVFLSVSPVMSAAVT